MSPLIQFKTTPPLLMTLALLCFGLLPRAQAAQIGDEVHSYVNFSDAVQIPGGAITEVTHITLDSGVWMVSAGIVFTSLNIPVGTLYVVGNIAVGPGGENPPDATNAIDSAQVSSAPAHLALNLAMPARQIDVENGTNVFLFGYVTENFPASNQGAFATGFLSAVKIRNHVSN
jgi:hypothetical protein